MSKGIFITGASGFLGQALLRALPADVAPRLALTGRHPPFPVPAAWSGRVTFLEASPRQPERYEQALADCDTVLHLAAQTGKARPAEFQRSNVEGTRALLAAARKAGVARFLFISSIAAGFPDLRHYPYGRSKAEAERLVRDSGLRTVIVRPTMIAGPGSPVFLGLTRLARLPLIPCFGSGLAPVQPILVSDLATIVATLLSADRFDGETITVGGPEAVLIGELLQRISLRATGRRRPTVSLPAAPATSLLALLEPVFLPILPVTAGQIQTFTTPGTAPRHPLIDPLLPSCQSLARMIEVSVAGPADALARECATFARYLIGTLPGPQIVAHYRAYHERQQIPTSPRGFDAVLTGLARKGPLATRLADSWGRFFAPRSLLRRKLVGLLAILEASPDTFSRIDRPTARGGLPSFLFGAGWRGCVTALCLLVGTVLLLLPWLGCWLFAPKDPAEVSHG